MVDRVTMMVVIISWADLMERLDAGLNGRERNAGWTDELWAYVGQHARWNREIASRIRNPFQSSDAAYLLRLLDQHGVRHGEIVDELRESVAGPIPGVGTTTAVATAVKEAGRQVRTLGFKGRMPHLKCDGPNDTLFLVHFQRSISGVTGREPAFTVNLNVVTRQQVRDWQALREQDVMSGELRAGADVGTDTRLGILAYGHDHWWTPSDDLTAHEAANEVAALMEGVGMQWLLQRATTVP